MDDKVGGHSRDWFGEDAGRDGSGSNGVNEILTPFPAVFLPFFSLSVCGGKIARASERDPLCSGRLKQGHGNLNPFLVEISK